MERPFTLIVAPLARRDILQAKAWLTQPGSGPRGYKRYAALNRAVVDLCKAPLRWPISGHGRRERTIERYRIVYRTDEETRIVTALRVFGPYQDRLEP